MINLDILATLMTSTNSVAVIGAVVALYTGKWLLVLMIEGRKVKHPLRLAIGAIAQTKDRNDFAKTFAKTSATIMALPLMRAPWQAYCHGLVQEPVEEPEQWTMRTMREPGEIFRDESILLPLIDRDFNKAIPARIRNLGLLASLLSLASTFYLMRTHFSAAEPVGIDLAFLQAGIYQLLIGFVQCLWPVVFGIVGAGMVDMFDRTNIRQVRALIRHLVFSLNARVQWTSPERISDLQLSQTVKLTTLMQELIALTKEHQGPGNIALAFRKINEAAMGLQERMAAAQAFHEQTNAILVEGLRKGVNALLGQMHGELRAMLDALSNTVSENLALLQVKDERDAFNLRIAELSHAVGILTQNSQETTLQQEKIVATTQGLIKAMAQMGLFYDKLIAQWEQYCQRFEGVDANLKDAFKQTNDSLVAYTQRFRTLTVDLDKHMSKGMLTLAGAVGDLHQAVGSLPQALKDAAKPAH